MTERSLRLDPALELLGATIRQYRKQRGLTQQELADQTALSATYILQIERGKRNISVLNLLRLANALQISSSSLLQPLEAHHEIYAPSRKESS